MEDYTPSGTEPDYAPRENTVLAEPATVEACRQDYSSAADIRATLTRQER